MHLFSLPAHQTMTPHQVNDVIDAPVVPSVTMETDGLWLHVLNLNSTSVGYISHKMFQCSQGPSVLYGFKAVISDALNVLVPSTYTYVTDAQLSRSQSHIRPVRPEAEPDPVWLFKMYEIVLFHEQ